MDRFILQTLFFISLIVINFSCLSSRRTQADIADESKVAQENVIVKDTFILPDIPAEITDVDSRAQYLVMHYWDRFDFADSKLVQRPEITEQAFVDYINILNYVSSEHVDKSMKHTLFKASVERSTYKNFASLFEKYLYEENSPFRNEEYYNIVLKYLLKSDSIDEVEKEKYKFQLNMSMKNRPNQSAADFVYTLSSGQSASMYSIKSDFLLILFANPGCPACNDIINRLHKSSVMQKVFSYNSPTRTMITVLTIYSDDDLQEWKNHLTKMPSNWLNAYDKGMIITKQNLYDLRFIPTIYLLDKNKKVLLKNTSVEGVENFFTDALG